MAPALSTVTEAGGGGGSPQGCLGRRWQHQAGRSWVPAGILWGQPRAPARAAVAWGSGPSYGTGDPSPRLVSDNGVVPSVWPPPRAQHKDDHPCGPSAAEAAGKSTSNWEVMERLTSLGKEFSALQISNSTVAFICFKGAVRTRVCSSRLPQGAHQPRLGLLAPCHWERGRWDFPGGTALQRVRR